MSTLSAPDENDKGSISFHSKTGNLFNMNVKVHKDTHHFSIHNLNNTDVHLTAEDSDNVIEIKGNSPTLCRQEMLRVQVFKGH